MTMRKAAKASLLPPPEWRLNAAEIAGLIAINERVQQAQDALNALQIQKTAIFGACGLSDGYWNITADGVVTKAETPEEPKND